MDASTLLTLAQSILQLLDSSFVKELGSIWGFHSQVAKIRHTMTTVNAVLLDAEEQERQLVPISNVEHDWLEKLRDVVYEADDIFDEIASVAHQKKLMYGGKLSKEVRIFFSRFNQFTSAFNASREVKKIRERLDDIAKDHRDFGHRPLVSGEGRIVTKRREESHSFVHVEDVIGRDADKKAVLDMVLNSHVQEDVHFIAIVGIGGLGKTTLAQLVYNDETVTREFPLRLWVCVSDEYDIKTLLCKILKSTANQEVEMEELQRQVRGKINGKKFLLVLDDVWNEDRHYWIKLRDFLIGGGRGSRVVVTTRSKMVARIVGDGLTYELKGLSEEDSWRLFERMAFENDEERLDVDLINIGKSILRKCSNVPLAIRIMGSLLYGHGKSKWISFRNMDLAKIKQDDKNGILAILKLSYHHLATPLKSCFAYCALFPKDFRMPKYVLLGLWMANGFIMPLEGQSAIDVGEDYLMTLVQRCFFQDVERDYCGRIMSYKIHDLMHDVAQEVAGENISVVNSAESPLNRGIRHLSLGKVCIESLASSLEGMKRIRTIFQLRGHDFFDRTSIANITVLLSKARYLRVLCLRHMNMKALPRTIYKLIHLRYLDLSYNYNMCFLPETLTKLNNLQTLKLQDCRSLEELPRDLNKLVNLRDLLIGGCSGLTHMPLGMSHLTCLHRLPQFVASPCGGKLKDLESLTNLRGNLKISVRGFTTYDVNNGAKYVRGMENLTNLEIRLLTDAGSISLLEGLQPHSNLKRLCLSGYKEATLPNWASLEELGTSLPNLVIFSLCWCRKLQHLPLLSRLRFLRILNLSRMDSLEYVEINAGENDDQFTFFPSLEKLYLYALPKLKGWRRSFSDSEMVLRPLPYSSPLLSRLDIECCPNMTSIPIRSSLEALHLRVSSDDLSASSSPSMFKSCRLTGNQELTIVFYYNDYLKRLSIVEKLFISPFSSSLHSLEIRGWCNLRSLCGGGLEHLTALQTLLLCELDDLEEMEDGDNNYTPWKYFGKLRDLHLLDLPKLVNFPQGIQYLTSIQSLHIIRCNQLTSLPEAMGNLTSLTTLEIEGCQYLDRKRLA